MSMQYSNIQDPLSGQGRRQRGAEMIFTSNSYMVLLLPFMAKIDSEYHLSPPLSTALGVNNFFKLALIILNNINQKTVRTHTTEWP